MKKLLTVMAAVAMVATLAVSCSKDDSGSKEDKTVKARVATFSLVGDGWADVYVYEYNTAGQVSRVYRQGEGNEKDWGFTYKGDSVIVTKASGTVAYRMVVNAAGYVTKATDEWGDVREYAYDANGHMTQVKKNGTVVSNITIQDGCIVSWTKWKDGAEVAKIHTFSAVKNTFKIQNISSEATDPSRWMYETCLFGVPSEYMCESSKWADSETTATYTYEYDANGCPIKEHKNYGGDLEEFEYTWEVIK